MNSSVYYLWIGKQRGPYTLEQILKDTVSTRGYGEISPKKKSVPTRGDAKQDPELLKSAQELACEIRRDYRPTRDLWEQVYKTLKKRWEED